MFDQYVAVAEIKVCFYFRISWRNISHIWSPPTAVDALCVHCAVALGQVSWCMWVTVSHTRTESVKLKSSLNLKSDIYLPKCWVELSSNSRMSVHFALCVHCAVALGQVLWCMWVTVSHTRAESIKVKSSLNLRKWHLSANVLSWHLSSNSRVIIGLFLSSKEEKVDNHPRVGPQVNSVLGR